MTSLSHLGTGLTLFTGRFGSGKSEAAIAYALALVQLRRGVILIDLDIVTPYFRSRETQTALRERGVTVIAPMAIGRHLDTPAITPEILGAIEQGERPTVVDVGGDRQGARALGQFSQAVVRRGYTMQFVVNPYRPFTGTLAALETSIAEIEATARLRVTSLVSNPNLMQDTTTEQILNGHRQVEQFAHSLKLPLAMICLTRDWHDRFGAGAFSQPTLVLDRFMTHPWEDIAAAPAEARPRQEEEALQ
ncbi:MAG TPA: hypothetical protein PKO09_14665 [Anaerolineae bacterium]|nr:hypothetical protein [Anaerolineae bacterium]